MRGHQNDTTKISEGLLTERERTRLFFTSKYQPIPIFKIYWVDSPYLTQFFIFGFEQN
jgi:hypothetical protein